MSATGDRNEMVPDFSVVVDVAEVDSELVPRSLPHWLTLPSREVIVCVDKPVSDRLKSAIGSAAGDDARLKVVEVARDPNWSFHQALVRRTGFNAASADRILTGDIDVVPGAACVQAVSMLGDDNIGMVSLAKRRGGGGPGEWIRDFTRMLMASISRKARFTGLYALFKPYWKDSEVEDEVRKIPHPESPGFSAGRFPYRGEDAILRDYMVRKHKVLYLATVGGTDLRVALGDRPVGQMKLGVKYAREGRTMDYVLIRSLAYARPRTMGAYSLIVAREKGGARFVGICLASIPRLLRFVLMFALGSRSLKP